MKGAKALTRNFVQQGIGTIEILADQNGALNWRADGTEDVALQLDILQHSTSGVSIVTVSGLAVGIPVSDAILASGDRAILTSDTPSGGSPLSQGFQKLINAICAVTHTYTGS